MAQIDSSTGKWLLFLSGIVAGVAFIGRLVIQPLFSAWIFFTLKREPDKMRALLGEPLEEIARKLDEVRDWQTEKGEEIAYIAGRLRGREE